MPCLLLVLPLVRGLQSCSIPAGAADWPHCDPGTPPCELVLTPRLNIESRQTDLNKL